MKKIFIPCLIALSTLAFNANAKDTLTVSDLATKTDTKAAFKEMASKHKLPEWVTKGGTNSETKNVELNGKKYQVLNACKPHDCGTERIAVLYSPEAKRMSGVLSTVDEEKASEKLVWLNISDDESIDGKTILFAALTGSLDNHPHSFNFK